MKRQRLEIARRVPWRPLAVVAAFAAMYALGACSSETENPLGNGDDLLGSKPGQVFFDTLDVIDDTSYVTRTTLTQDSIMEVGIDAQYRRAVVMRGNFSNPGDDVTRTVQTAELRILHASGQTGDTRVIFYRLANRFNESDTLSSLDTLEALVDPNTGGVERAINPIVPRYPLPPELVQGWIRGDSVNTGIAIVYDDTGDKVVRLLSSESTNKATIQVTFTDLEQSSYDINQDATYFEPINPSNNLILSDGYVRRIHFRVDLDQLSDSAATHQAVVRFNIVPGSVSGSSVWVEIYAPESTDPTTSGFRNGVLVDDAFIEEDSGYVDIRLTNAILLILEGTIEDNGFVLKYVNENRGLKQSEFYTTDDPLLAPKVLVTSSTPAEFDK